MDAMGDTKLYPRYLLPRLRQALADTPALLVHGPRQCGKTTLTRMLGKRYTYYTFDDRDLLAAVKRDPVGFVERLAIPGTHPIFDKWLTKPSIRNRIHS